MSESSVRHVYVTATFRRSAKRASKHSPDLGKQIRDAVELLEADMFAPVVEIPQAPRGSSRMLGV